MCIWAHFALQPSALFLDFLKQISPAHPHRKSSSLIWQQDTLTYPTTIARRYQKSPRGSLKVSQWLMCSAFQTSRQGFVPNKNQKLCSPSAPTFILKSCSGSEDGWHSCSARLQSRLSSFLKRVSPAVRALCFITVDFRLRQKGEMRLTRWRQLKCFQYLLSSCVASVTPALVTCDQSWDELHPCWARPGFLSRGRLSAAGLRSAAAPVTRPTGYHGVKQIWLYRVLSSFKLTMTEFFQETRQGTLFQVSDIQFTACEPNLAPG